MLSYKKLLILFQQLGAINVNQFFECEAKKIAERKKSKNKNSSSKLKKKFTEISEQKFDEEHNELYSDKVSSVNYTK